MTQQDIDNAQKLEKLEKSVYAVYNALFNPESEEGKDAKADLSKDADGRVAEISKVFDKIASKAITLKDNAVLEKELAEAKTEIETLKAQLPVVETPVEAVVETPAPTPVPAEVGVDPLAPAPTV